MAAIAIRAETTDDAPALHALNVSAFAGDTEADLVDRLRREARPLLSLVAVENGKIVGHIMFSQAPLAGREDLVLAGLAPMAVRPDRQGHGIGSALVQAGLDACRDAGIDVVVVLGHPGYYLRFGFVPASRFGLRCRWEVPDEAFMLRELRGGCVGDTGGQVEYHPAFNGP